MCVLSLIGISVVGWLAAWMVCLLVVSLSSCILIRCYSSTLFFVIVSLYYICFLPLRCFLSQFHFWLFFFLFVSCLLCVDFRCFYLVCVVFFSSSSTDSIYFTHNIWMRDIIRWSHKNIYFIVCQEACAFGFNINMFWDSQSHCQLYCGIIRTTWNKREKEKKISRRIDTKHTNTRGLVNKLVVDEEWNENVVYNFV